MCLFVELQSVVAGGTTSLESCAWAKLFLFDGICLLSGRWRVPFRQLPFEDIDATSTDTHQACNVQDIEAETACSFLQHLFSIALLTTATTIKYVLFNLKSVWYSFCRLVAWHSGRMSVSDRRTFPVLRSTCSWRVTTYVGKPSAVGQPTRPTQPFILSG